MNKFKCFSLFKSNRKKVNYLLLIIFTLYSYSCNTTEVTEINELNFECQNATHLETYGDYAYDFIKYDLAFKSPFEVISIQDSTKLKQMVDSLIQANESYSLEQVYENLGEDTSFIISTDLKNAIFGLNNAIQSELELSPSFSSLISTISNFESQYLSTHILNCPEHYQFKLIVILSKSIVNYWNENMPPSYAYGSTSRTDCNFWKQIGCFFEGFFKIIGYVLFSQLVLFLIQGPLLTSGGVVLALILAFLSAINAGDSINCCPKDCSPPLGVSIAFNNDCIPSGTYRAWGFGSDINTLLWQNVDGNPFNAISNPPNQSLLIEQPNMSIPVKTTVAAGCSNGQVNFSNEFTNNLYYLSKQVKGIALFGPMLLYKNKQHLAEGKAIQTYYLAGFDSNRHEITGWSAWHGAVLGYSGSSCQIQWDFTKVKGQVLATVRNKCQGGSTKSYDIYVEFP